MFIVKHCKSRRYPMLDPQELRVSLMDWSNENYVRLYTRETDDDLVLSWEARAVWHEMLKRFDRSGFMAIKRGRRGLAAMVRMPLEVVERVIPELLDDGRIREIEAGYIAPNFMEAQEATKSDRQRQRDSRTRRRAQNLHSVTDLHSDVTFCDADVTPTREVVTLTSADPKPDPVRASRTHAHAIPPTPKANLAPDAPTPVLSTRFQKQGAWWQAMLDAHDRLRRPTAERSAIKPGTPDLARHPNEQALAACERFLRDAGYDDAGVDAKMRHVVVVHEAEAEKLRHLDYFKPALIWDVTKPDRFPRKVDTSLEEVRRGRASSEPREIQVRRDRDESVAAIPKWHGGGS